VSSAQSLQSSDRLVLHPLTVVRQETPDRWLFFFPPSRGLHFVRPLGKEIVDLCDGDRSVDQVAREVISRHGLQPQEALEYVTRFLQDLVNRRVLTVREEA